jgi:hypothetical protein
MTKKIMLSNGLRGKENPDAYIQECRGALADYCIAHNIDYELLHSYKPSAYADSIDARGVQYARIAMLGETITQELAECDILAMVDDWYNYDGCYVEFEVARRYGKEIIFVWTTR